MSLDAVLDLQSKVDIYYAIVKEDTKQGELTVQSNVNTAKAGSYYVDYIVNAGAISGKSILVVVVQ